tara:strand:+ start:2754 stop:3938 length:1185 start_codon:yes stop_codon:yes gene_type:complete
MFKRISYFLLVIFWLEMISFITLIFLSKRLPNVVFNPKNYNFTLDSSKNNLSDPLGWGSENLKESTIDVTNNCRVHLFGDSFMAFIPYKLFKYKNEFISPENIISKKTGCKIFNYGVGGYGSDQAYLKFKDQIAKKNLLPGDFIILSHLTENILRNSTRNHRLLYPISSKTSTMLKPKFKLNDNGQLTLISIPKDLNNIELSEINQKGFTARTVKEENSLFIVNDVKGSPSEIKFPYTVNFFKIIFSWHLLPRFYGEEKWYPFYKEDSIHYLVTKKILREFHHTSIKNGLKPISLDLPLAYDFNKFFKSNQNNFPLTEYLKSINLNHHSFGNYLTKNYPVVLRNKCFIYNGINDGGDDCKFHFNQKGYILMINFISELINNSIEQKTKGTFKYL